MLTISCYALPCIIVNMTFIVITWRSLTVLGAVIVCYLLGLKRVLINLVPVMITIDGKFNLQIIRPKFIDSLFPVH